MGEFPFHSRVEKEDFVDWNIETILKEKWKKYGFILRRVKNKVAHIGTGMECQQGPGWEYYATVSFIKKSVECLHSNLGL